MEIDREEVTQEREERQEEIAKESVESEAIKRSKPVETKESTSSATSSYAAVVQSGPAVPAKVKKVKPSARLVRNSQRIPFMDSHFHLDRMQQQSRMEDLEEILANGPIQQTPMKLEAAIANFIDGVPSRSVRRELSKDRRLFFTFGVHRKRAHKVTPEEMKVVKEVVLKEPKCVGIGEMGYDLTDGCSVHLDKQMKVCKEQLRHYASKELWPNVMVIQCQDSVYSRKATEL